MHANPPEPAKKRKNASKCETLWTFHVRDWVRWWLPWSMAWILLAILRSHQNASIATEVQPTAVVCHDVVSCALVSGQNPCSAQPLGPPDHSDRCILVFWGISLGSHLGTPTLLGLSLFRFGIGWLDWVWPERASRSFFKSSAANSRASPSSQYGLDLESTGLKVKRSHRPCKPGAQEVRPRSCLEPPSLES